MHDTIHIWSRLEKNLQVAVAVVCVKGPRVAGADEFLIGDRESAIIVWDAPI